MTVLRERLTTGMMHTAQPAIYLVLFLGFAVLWRILDGPNPTQMLDFSQEALDRYGMFAIAAAAFVEGLLLVNLYFPGSAVILIGVVLSKDDPARVVQIVAITSASFFIASQVNYSIGIYGLQPILQKLDRGGAFARAHERYRRHGWLVLLPAFSHPNLAAFVTVACAVARLSWRRFVLISAVSTCAWNVFWGVVAYQFADTVAQVATQPSTVFLGLLIWTISMFVRGFLKARLVDDHDRE